MKGKPTDWIEAACVYTACKSQNVSRSLKEVASFTLVTPKNIGACFIAMKQMSEPSKPAKVQAAVAKSSTVPIASGSKVPAQDPIPGGLEVVPGSLKDLVSRGVNQLGLQVRMEKYVIRLIQFQDKVGILGSRAHPTVVASALYFVIHALGNPFSAAIVGQALNTSSTTVKSAYK